MSEPLSTNEIMVWLEREADRLEREYSLEIVGGTLRRSKVHPAMELPAIYGVDWEVKCQDGSTILHTLGGYGQQLRLKDA